MTCQEAERLVTPYIRDELSGDELEAFLNHIDECPNCREELEREGYITSVPGKGSFVAKLNRELLREEQFRKVESYLGCAVEAARMAGITCEEMEELVRTLYEE